MKRIFMTKPRSEALAYLANQQGTMTQVHAALALAARQQSEKLVCDLRDAGLIAIVGYGERRCGHGQLPLLYRATPRGMAVLSILECSPELRTRRHRQRITEEQISAEMAKVRRAA
jgi:hypothetical protein